MAIAQRPGAGATKPAPATGYPSARDLPTFKKLTDDLQSAKLLSGLQPSIRPQLKELETKLNELVSSVDGFYALIGDRNWVFHETLSSTLFQPALAAKDPDALEAAVIAQYQDELKLDIFVNQLKQLPDMTSRIPLIFKTKADFRAGRYYSVVLVLITVMDGFVNDVERERRGLHARDEDEMVAWNSVVGHHMGLRNAHRSFTKSFKATSDLEVFELHRNGIVHGNLTNFDNIIVASKAWNRLFSVADWSRSIEKAKVPEKEPATWSSIASTLKQTAENKKHNAAWSARTVSAIDGGEDALRAEPVLQAATELFSHWKSSNFGGMSFRLKPLGKAKSKAELAGQTRKNFEGFSLDDFLITQMESVAPAVSVVKAELTVNGSKHASETRWVFESKSGQSLAETQAGGNWICLESLPEGLAPGALPRF